MRFLCLFLLVLTTAQLRAQTLSDDEKKAGFILLFNGKDFSGWRFQKGSALGMLPKNWSVADGLIQLHGGGSPHLASQWPFDDFDMRFQWKAHKKGYNSGFYVRSGREVNANQINLAEKACGQLINGAAAAKAVPELQKPAGEWNDWRVLAEGDKLTFWCNGKEAWSVSGFKPASGYVGFQAEGAAIDFKNIRIRELGTIVLGNLKDWSKSNGWTQEGDVLVGAKDATLFAPPGPHKSFVLRLEFQGGNGGIAFGSDKNPAIALGANPAEWHYLQATVAKGKATLWINGEDHSPPLDVSAEAWPIRIIAGVGLRVRNVRIRDTK